ncbi:histone deacetylase 5 [Phtheirospermum japonicum]|uniref:histone deacetylase n=1 Tax=Phtheirospermum japonicum TaxID=374723 RepID=A0A830BTZ0_9LAMI|nr:histone deacetylase 5 [Phtheirospermum japonicum]
MCKHHAPYDEDHPECPGRIRAIWDRLNSSGLPTISRCVILNAKDAEDKHLALVHTKNHIDLIKNISSINSEFKRKKTAAKYDSVYFNEGSSEAAYLAAGSVIEVAEKVAKGELDSGFAIVRPPGHHAEQDRPMGFCLHNNVAVATSYLLNERMDLGINKILIVDWDVHHGNGTQKMFYSDPRVLFFSVHRYDNGTFFPSSHDGSYIMTGEDQGAGYNINVPWESGGCGDSDYIAVWDQILIPVAKEFNPDMIIISAGFDAAIGDPLGGCRVSPYGFSILLEKLMEFAGGKIVMALEGGYSLKSIANSAYACVEVLLQGKPIVGSLEAYPFESTWHVIQEVI